MGCNANVTHFDKSVFGDDAGEFVPERWLEGDVARMDVSIFVVLLRGFLADVGGRGICCILEGGRGLVLGRM